MFRYLPLILKYALRSRRRSILTICSVAASLCLLGVLMAIYHEFYFGQATPAQALRLVTSNRISLATVMPISYRQKILQAPGVREAMVLQWFGGVYKDPKNVFARFAVEPARLFMVTHDPHAAKFATKIRHLDKGLLLPEGAEPEDWATASVAGAK